MHSRKIWKPSINPLYLGMYWKVLRKYRLTYAEWIIIFAWNFPLFFVFFQSCVLFLLCFVPDPPSSAVLHSFTLSLCHLCSGAGCLYSQGYLPELSDSVEECTTWWEFLATIFTGPQIKYWINFGRFFFSRHSTRNNNNGVGTGTITEDTTDVLSSIHFVIFLILFLATFTDSFMVQLKQTVVGPN